MHDPTQEAHLCSLVLALAAMWVVRVTNGKAHACSSNLGRGLQISVNWAAISCLMNLACKERQESLHQASGPFAFEGRCIVTNGIRQPRK